jgi:curved DNA-binding protein CbpA
MAGETHYDVLGVSPRATQEQIDKAYQFLRQMYDEVSLATYSLLDPEEARVARARVNQAYEVLKEAHRRQDYDASLEAAREKTVVPFPPAPAAPHAPTMAPVTPHSPPTAPVTPHPPAAAPAVAAPREPPHPHPEPLAPASVLAGPVTGELLRRFREEKGVSLQTISASSKVGVRFFEYIEADRHADLPARVYLRSFLQEYAKAVGLDPNGVADAYIARLPK